MVHQSRNTPRGMMIGTMAPDSSPVHLGTPEGLRQGLRRAAQLKGRQPQDDALTDVRALIEALAGEIGVVWSPPRQQVMLSSESPRLEFD